MEILNTYSSFNNGLSMLGIFGLCGIAILIIFTLLNLIVKERKNALICFLVAIPIALLTFAAFAGVKNSETVHHEVIVTDYNKIDFQKYQIVEQRGKITILKEIR